MEFSTIFTIVLVALVVTVFYRIATKSSTSNVMEGTKPTTARPRIRANRPATKEMRRRRNGGGFYPVGYDGSYEEGEDLVDFIIWMAILSEMSDFDREELGDYGGYDGYTEDDYEDAMYEEEHPVYEPEIDDEPTDEPAYEAPEAEVFEVIEDTPEEETRNSSWGGDSGWDSGGSDDGGGWDSDD